MHRCTFTTQRATCLPAGCCTTQLPQPTIRVLHIQYTPTCWSISEIIHMHPLIALIHFLAWALMLVRNGRSGKCSQPPQVMVGVRWGGVKVGGQDCWVVDSNKPTAELLSTSPSPTEDCIMIVSHVDIDHWHSAKPRPNRMLLYMMSQVNGHCCSACTIA